ncbi:MAG TPA: SDR family oxidoreductase, partial [Bryobacteraceae bacterium]|nr:SDR family oxidoreductase [Bryobacteraceae bacterium]
MGKIVLITGGSRGLGLAMAREFGSHGATVAICARDEAELKAAQADLARRGVRAHAFPCDISNRDQVFRMIAEATGQLGRIDILVNNAGILKVGPFSQMDVADFEDAMKVMFWGPLYATLAVLPAMRARGEGGIVNITSIGGKVSMPHLLPYSCAKFAAVALSEGLRAELAPSGIRVTTIAPGLLRTGSHLRA